MNSAVGACSASDAILPSTSMNSRRPSSVSCSNSYPMFSRPRTAVSGPLWLAGLKQKHGRDDGLHQGFSVHAQSWPCARLATTEEPRKHNDTHGGAVELIRYEVPPDRRSRTVDRRTRNA